MNEELIDIKNNYQNNMEDYNLRINLIKNDLNKEREEKIGFIDKLSKLQEEFYKVKLTASKENNSVKNDTGKDIELF